MSKRRYLTGKEVQAMMQAVCYGGNGSQRLLSYSVGISAWDAY